ncbi:peroxiredoxin family protein [Hufsiella ginkgonis]|uniref:Redoxin domain-containing protein n=1 Tax=Hufsiella ginkgonis TaxID=2695274 RepID=A0A7K1XT55_9SPHI|nr:redoxin domain-containing protein [Hufsiella ginkgonis]MXV14185.1 redoxin domain-containing protein [Hufsiella ginkgonis]
MFRKIQVLLFVLALSAGAHAQLAINSEMPSKFKFYKLSDSSGFGKANFEKGKKSLVIFFDAGCEHCQQEMLAINKRLDEFRNVHFYLVSMDKKPAVERFMKRFAGNLENNKSVTILLDPEQSFVPTFFPERFPGLYIFSADQKLVWHKDGQRELDELLAALK